MSRVAEKSLSGIAVALVNPPIKITPNFVNYPLFAGLGVLYNAAWLERLGAQVSVVDAFISGSKEVPIWTDGRLWQIGCPPDELVGEMEGTPDVIVIGTSMFAHPGRLKATFLSELLDKLAKRFAKTAVVLADLYCGGLDYLPYEPRRVLESLPQVLAVCTGEGESALYALLQALSGRCEWRGVPRTVWRDGRRIRKGVFPGPLIEDIDQLEPAFYLIDVERFLRLQQAAGPLDLIHEFPAGGRFLPLLSSRGCPFRCAFCAKGFSGYRQASAEAVLRLCRKIQRLFRPEKIFFMDDCMNAHPRRFSKIVSGLLRAGISLEIPNGIRADRLDEETVDRLCRAGLSVPSLSLEAADDYVRNRLIGKNLDLEKFRRAVGWFSSRGLRPRVHGIIGFPGENRRQINRTLLELVELTEKMNAEPRLQFATPVPGTPLYRIARKRFLLRDTATTVLDELFCGRSVIKTEKFSPAVLEDFYRNFQLRIKRLRERKLLLAPLYACNNRCTFCCTADFSPRPAKIESLQKELEKAFSSGLRRLDIDGGEPTLYPQLAILISCAKELGFERVTLITNARRTAYFSYARELRRSGLDSAVVTLLSADEKIHDAITRSVGSWRQAKAGIENLAACGTELYGNVVLLEENLSGLASTVRLLLELGCVKVNLQYPLALGEARTLSFPSPKALKEAFDEALQVAGEGKLEVHNLQPCLFPKLRRRLSFAGGKFYLDMLQASGRHTRLDRETDPLAQYPDECDSCRWRVLCPGMWKRQLAAGIRPRPF